MENFETPGELTREMQHKESNLEAIAHEIKELENILESIEQDPSKIKDIYLAYRGKYEEDLKDLLKNGFIDGPNPDETDKIVTYFKNELKEVKQDQKEKAADTN